MPRPSLTDEQVQSTRAAILAATARIIASGGYGAFSMRVLARDVGLTAGALYRYFPTKQHVLVAYWSDALTELERRLVAILDSRAELDRVIHATLLAYAEFALEDRDRFRLLFLENDMGEINALIPDATGIAPYHRARALVAEAIDRGLFRPMSSDIATRILWGAIHGVVTLVITVRELDFSDAESLVRETAETVMRGLSSSHDIR